ncbi:MAG: RNA polymerase sigma factor [Armatimonadota bacterium]
MTDFHKDDARLVGRAQAGDQAAFRQLFETYGPLVYRVAARMVGEEDAADLTQDVFVRAYQRLGSLHDGQAFHAWITRLAVNVAHDHLRRRKPQAFSLDAPPPGTEEGSEWQLPSDAPTAEHQLLSGELCAQIQNALGALSPDHRAVVVLHHLEHLPVEQIAETLGVPIGTVKSRLARARAELKKVLAEYLEARV